MRDAFKALLTSRKFVAMLAGIVVSLAARYGLNLPEREVAGIIGLFIAYILAQGQADKGKEAARVVACPCQQEVRAGRQRSLTGREESTRG